MESGVARVDVEEPADRPPASGGSSPPAPVWLALVATLLGLMLGWALKAPCTTHAWAGEYQYSHLCYNDIQPLFGGRGIADGQLPYQQDNPLEYPVLTGTFMHWSGILLRGIADSSALSSGSPWLLVGAALGIGAAAMLSVLRSRAARASAVVPAVAAAVLAAAFAGAVDANGNAEYFHLSAILLAPFALAVTFALRPLVPWERLLLWAIGSPLVLYAFHNWDLIAVAGAVWAFAALERGSFGLAGGALGFGASAKLYPAFLLPAFLLERLSVRDRRGAGRIAAGFVAVAAVSNVYWMFRDWDGWLDIWGFHARRYPDFGTIWFWLAHHGRRLLPLSGWDPPGEGMTSWFQEAVSVLSLVVFGAGCLWFLWKGWKRVREGPDGYPVAAVALGIVALFLLVSKVHSPQYALWVVPLLALLDVPWRYVFAYLAGDMAVFISGFYYFTVRFNQAPGWMGIFEVAVILRAAALGLLIWYSLRASRVHPAGSRQDGGRPGGPGPTEPASAVTA
jgi:uncharacterized membrane protein